jgi:hypothetical protein
LHEPIQLEEADADIDDDMPFDQINLDSCINSTKKSPYVKQHKLGEPVIQVVIPEFNFAP